MRRIFRGFALPGALALALLIVAGCAIGQAVPPKPRPLGQIAREEPGEVMTVRDTTVDLRTGTARSLPAPVPRIGVGPIALPPPVKIGGEKRVEMAAEEITVRLRTGEIVVVTQELSSPPFAPGERVKVQYEQRSDNSSQVRSRVVRE